MAVAMRLLLLGLAGLAQSRQCFDDAIPEHQRKTIVFDGVEMPIGIWENGWDSSLVASSIFEILVTEKLGFNISRDRGSTSRLIVFKLAGCNHTAGTAEITGGCGTNTRFLHFSFENWQGSEDYIEPTLKSFGDKAPRNIGPCGYAGYEGMFVMGGALNAGLTGIGLGLDFYRNWNADWFNPTTYTKKVSDVDINRLVSCADGVMTAYPDTARHYLAATGDSAGVQTVNGEVVLNCYQDKWFVSAACRNDPQNCATLLTSGDGWGMPSMIQQAFFHNMPIAFAGTSEYTALNRELQSTTYWWTPDTTFVSDNASRIIFPDYSPSEQKRNIFRTMKDNTPLSKWAAGGIEVVADKALAIAEAMFLAGDDVTKLLKSHLQLATPPDAWVTACEWLKNSEAQWSDWMPNETACTAGKGLVDWNGNFVMNRGEAVSCAICPVGHYSLEQGQTRVCTPCPLGTSQMLPGESVCIPCEKGKIAAQTGSMSCSLCGLGEYAEAAGMSQCHRCGNGTGQEERWTTSQMVLREGQETWIQVQGSDNISYCGCVAGAYLWNGLCETCIEGSICEGSSKLLLQKGYFSWATEPGMVYKCFGESARCPGGEPGTCAFGRDTTSIACAVCQPGLHEKEGICVECGGGDYALVISVTILGVCAIAVLYLVLMGEGQKSKQPGSLLVAALGMGQMVTIVQQLTVVQQFKIDWGEPFASILVAMELMAFDMDMISVGCVAPMDPVTKFTMRTLLVLVFFGIAAVVHFAYLAWHRGTSGAKGLQISLLARTVGTLFMVFFISLCSSLLAPFRCDTHPNGLQTVQAYHGVYCNGEGEHLSMAIVGACACLLPLGFLAICFWVIIIELPKRLLAADVKFIRACSFLFMRFRPGAELFSVLFLIRNALVVLCPLLPGASAKVVSMNLLLYASLCGTAFSKPWRAMLCNFLDMMLIVGMLVILDMGSLFVEDNDAGTTMIICLIFSFLMLLSIVSAVGYGIGRHFLLKYRKQFRFFLCHQKVAAGSMARLLKMELQKRGSRFATFVDCDDLNDLTKLFSYVGQDTETFVIMGSPDILTRKWCVGEMCTARSHKVHTVLLAWPEFMKPDKMFIENYESIVPDITELANYNIGMQEVADTMRWINTIECVDVPHLISTESIDTIVSSMTGTVRTRSMNADARTTPDCLILADLDNMEAAATAYVLLGLIVQKLMGGQKNNMPAVLQKDKTVPSTAVSALVICSDGCFKSFQFAERLLAVARMSGCCVLPIIAEDGFRFPAQTYYEEIETLSQLQSLDIKTYIRAIKAVFQEIAVVFSPQNYSSTQEDLDLRAKQVAWRINSGALKSLYQKISGKEDDEDVKRSSKVEENPDVELNNVLPELPAEPEAVLAEVF